MDKDIIGKFDAWTLFIYKDLFDYFPGKLMKYAKFRK